MAALLLLLWACVAGALLARRLDTASTRLVETLALGAGIGLATLSGFGFVLGWAFGLTSFTVLGAAVLTMAAGLGLGASPATFFKAGEKRPSTGVLLLCLLSAMIVSRLADRTLFETPLGIATGDRHNFGDLPFHMAIAAGFAYGDNFPPAHPELAGVPLTYPFFCDLLSGMILAVGGSWRDAFFWPTLILGLAVVVALVRFGEAVTGSRSLGRTAAFLTFFSGGLGFLSLSRTTKVLGWWSNGPDLTMNEAGMRYANFITTLFIPQRSILFGWPLLFFALAFLVESLDAKESEATRARIWLHAGVVASFLPLVHAHSFLILGVCSLWFAIRAGWMAPAAFARGVVPLALPAILFMVTHNSLSTGKFFEWSPGFDGGHDHPLRFWLMNAGVFLPLALLGIARASSSSMRFVAAPFAALFIAANLFRLSPWMWDNMKFLAPAHAGLAPFAAIALALGWQRGGLGKAAAAAGFCIATLSGALDVSKVLLASGEFGIFDRTGLAFAEKIRAATPPSTTILSAPNHNHPALLSGRRLFLGYEGHLWSQGLDYAARKPVAEAIFRGEPQEQPGTPPLIPVDALAWTDAEVRMAPDPAKFAGLPSLVDSPYRLLKIR